jgi:hypothetical protein
MPWHQVMQGMDVGEFSLANDRSPLRRTTFTAISILNFLCPRREAIFLP